MYIELANERVQSGELLELGAGTGRISIPLAARGHKIAAVDRMRAMLDRMQEKLDALEEEGNSPSGSIEMVHGEITTLPFEEQSISLCIAPFNVLMHLYRWEELLQCFREVYRVLEPGGTFAFDVLLPDLEWLHLDPEKRHCITHFVHPETGKKMVYSTNHEYDHDTQICHIRIYYDEANSGRFRRRGEPKQLVHLSHRQIFPEEARVLLSWAGFEIEAVSGDFLGLSLNQDVESQVFVCRKPE